MNYSKKIYKVLLSLFLFLNCSSLLAAELQCANSNVRDVTINELFNGGGGAGNLEFIEIYFKKTTDVTNWKLYFHDKNTDADLALGDGDGTVTYPDGSSGTDNVSTYPKGTFIVYDIGGIDPTNGEVFVVNTTSALSDGDQVLIDYFKYFKNSEETSYDVVTPSECSIQLDGADPNAKDISRLTDGSGDFYQYYPGTDDDIEVSTGSSNLDNLPSDSNLTASVSISADFNQTEAYNDDLVTLSLKIENPSSDSITVTDVNVSNIIPSGLKYESDNNGTLLDPTIPSNPYGETDSTFLWRLINGSTILSFPTDSTAEVNVVLEVNTTQCDTNISNTASLSTKQTNNGDISDTAYINIICETPDNNDTNTSLNYNFDAWDTFRSIFDRNISTKITPQNFELIVASLNETNNDYQDFNGTVCACVEQSCLSSIFNEQNTTTMTFNVNKAVKSTHVDIKWWKDDYTKSCLDSDEDNSTTSTDDLAIRPNNFSISTPTDIYAAEDFQMDFSTNNTTNYNETKNSSFKVESNSTLSGCSIGTLTLDSFSFTDGVVNNVNAEYSNLGDINITIKEVLGSEFAIIDVDDTNDSLRLIESFTDTITVKPYELNITIADMHSSTNNDWLYMADVDDMNLTLSATVGAYNKNGLLLQDFNSTCYAKDVDLSFDVDTDGTSSLDMNYTVTNASFVGGSSGTTLADIDKNITISASDFISGKASAGYALNVDRNYTNPIAPFNVENMDVSVVTTTASKYVNGSNDVNRFSFYYGRTSVDDIKTTNSSINHFIEFEVYDPDNTLDFQQNSLNWSRNENHDSNESGKVLSINSSGSITASVSNPSDGRSTLTLSGTTSGIMHVDVDEWLWYVPFNCGSNCYYKSLSDGGDCSNHPCFNYTFKSVKNPKGVNTGSFRGSDYDTPSRGDYEKTGVKVFR